MSRNEVIEAYVVDVMRRLPGKDRNGIGYELRGLLGDMLSDRAQDEGRDPDDAMVLAVLREFGAPAEVAQRYRPPGMLVIPADQTRLFVPLAIAGIALQWSLTLPRVFEGQPLSGWWLSWGLGAFWWPGFLAMTSLAVAWLRQVGLIRSSMGSPRIYDPERINRSVMAFGLLWFACGVALMTSLPWLATRMPEPMAGVFAFDPGFLHARAWPAVVLWLGSFATMASVLVRGRWTTLTRHLEIGFAVGFALLLGWWLASGPIFQAKPTNDGARLALSLVIFIIAIDVVKKTLRQGTRIRLPRTAG
jgi:hypothetical protein